MKSSEVTTKLTGLARSLVLGGFLSESDATEIVTAAETTKTSLISQLTLSKKVPLKFVAEVVGNIFNFPVMDIDTIDFDQLPKGAVDNKTIFEKRILPIRKTDKTLYVAISDPTNIAILDELKFSTGLTIFPIVVEDDKLEKMVERLLAATDTSMSGMHLSDVELDFEDAKQEEVAEQEETGSVEDAPVVKYLQKILIDAINLGASDIHFEPYEKVYRVRYRVDGELEEISSPPLAIKEKLASRIKIISSLDISEKRVPQDGKMKLKLSATRTIDFRVSTLPCVNGEKIVMRILDPSSATLGIDALGYETKQKEDLLAAINRPYGLVLVTGPTGSGKTVSLYTCLNILNGPKRNISTAEDPCEIPLFGMNQVSINEKQGLTFAAALKSFLRQDPDIIMIGEIRDLETADMAMKAASTGHMVLSTLHTNDAPSTLTRLINMGVAPFNIASAVSLITAQRLARRLCKSCKEPHTLSHDEMLKAGFLESDIDANMQLYKAHEGGCEACNGNGYKGRVGIYQVMPVTDAISRLIMKDGTAHDIADQAKKEGVNDLRRSGLLKAKQGLTSLDEVYGCTNEH